jgi:hypothetical protein
VPIVTLLVMVQFPVSSVSFDMHLLILHVYVFGLISSLTFALLCFYNAAVSPFQLLEITALLT